MITLLQRLALLREANEFSWIIYLFCLIMLFGLFCVFILLDLFYFFSFRYFTFITYRNNRILLSSTP